jgi:hypothetical protein
MSIELKYLYSSSSFDTLTFYDGTCSFDNSAAPDFVEVSDLNGEDNTFGTPDDGLNLAIRTPLRRKANLVGLEEYKATASPAEYFRDANEFTDATERVRINSNIDEIGAYEKFIRIMCVGDDNTVGWSMYNSRDTENNYRKKLKELLDAANIDNEFVGSIACKQGGYEGENGKKIDYFAGRIVGVVENNHPNLILFLGGTSDIATGIAAQTVFDKLYKSSTSSFVHNIKNKLNADTRLIISLIPPTTNSTLAKTNFPLFNSLIDNKNWSSVNSFITKVNPITNQIVSSTDPYYPNTEDKKLLTQTGYDIFAQKYFDAISAM